MSSRGRRPDLSHVCFQATREGRDAHVPTRNSPVRKPEGPQSAAWPSLDRRMPLRVP
ncbi:hypothetical protein BN2476_830078 [Paraburkholderia piptadeniae]|uniref:Uncharacterized protein n=1 Tax=Paraburkholderia piptadeniae TaxID=1701573 RepID=A0A1N7SUB1_9BURK|nr:hypothetical protein BN2476_830078 [Paraburkholderia piptadeniae]